MSAGLALHLKALRLPQLRGMVLIYPGLGADFNSPSYIRNANAPCLTKPEMIFYLDCFLGPKGNPNWRDPKAIPNIAENLKRLPPAFITVAAHDPLRDDGFIFHDKMKASGIPVALREEPVLAHSYMRARHVSAPAKKGFNAIVEALKSLGHRECLPD